MLIFAMSIKTNAPGRFPDKDRKTMETRIANALRKVNEIIAEYRAYEYPFETMDVIAEVAEARNLNTEELANVFYGLCSI